MYFVYPGPKAWVQSSGRRLLNGMNQKWFRRIHGSQLIYNTCWEDPRMDRSWMTMDASSRVLMITSAGCNALDYLLDDPEKVVCVDMNYRQNALLELKKAVFKTLSYADLWRLFGCGQHHSFESLYLYMKPNLPAYAARYWDERQHYFRRNKVFPSFYFQGTSGKAAFCFHQFLKRSPRLRHTVMSLLEADSLDDQARIYASIEPVLLNRLVCWFLKQPSLMTLLGVPTAQMDLIQSSYPNEGMIEHIKASLRQALTKTPMHDNYFWHVYIKGFYTRECCPNYLKKEHHTLLKDRAARIETHTRSLTQYLQQTSETFTHFVLLDHQDWLAHVAPELLEEEWREIFKHAAPGAKVLMRSAARRIEFLPAWVTDRLSIDEASATELHALDRVGTYGCTFTATITS